MAHWDIHNLKYHSKVCVSVTADCPPIKTPNNSKLNSSSVTYGSVVSVICDDPNSMFVYGRTAVECVYDGKWNDILGNCECKLKNWFILFKLNVY
jgi:hypothetical protein